ncbi:MAG: glycosyltransferase [Gemmatimonadota bacterium]
MKVLFLLSSLEPAGSETYCRSLERAWSGRHDVWWVSDRLFFGQEYLSLPITRKLIPHGLRNIVRLARECRRRRIDVIHAHSRRANTVAAGVSALTGIPYVTSVHLRHPDHLFQRLLPCWGRAALAVCETIRDNLLNVHHVEPVRVHLVRNGIDISSFQPAAEAPEPGLVTFLGRMSGKRWNAVFALLEALPAALGSNDALRVRFTGHSAGDRREQLFREVGRLNERFGSGRVEVTPFEQDVRGVIAGSVAVVASGRSLLESMAMGRPVIALGEQEAIGLLGPDNLGDAMSSNFGDFPRQSVMSSAVLSDSLGRVAALTSRELSELGSWSRSQVESHYSLATTASQVEHAYAAAMTS